MNDLVRQLLVAGSVAALAAKIGSEEAAATAMHELVQTAPEEIQESWPYVIAWGRMQAAYEIACELGMLDDQLKITRAQAQLVRDVY